MCFLGEMSGMQVAMVIILIVEMFIYSNKDGLKVKWLILLGKVKRLALIREDGKSLESKCSQASVQKKDKDTNFGLLSMHIKIKDA